MDIERAKELFKMRIETEEYSGMTTNTLKEAMTTVLSELERKDEYIKMLTDEREHIKNNLKVDLNRKGVFSQAKGQIAQILEYYENNEKYFTKKVEGK